MNAAPIILSGLSHPDLAKEIAEILQVPLGKIHIHNFPDQEIYIEILDNVRNRNVFVVQSLGQNIHTSLIELLIIIDALKRADASSITAVLPYYPYARQDRVNKPGAAITAKLMADLLTAAGAHKIITLDLHSDQIEGFFNIPLENLLSRSLFIPYLQKMNFENLVVVAPDQGGVKIAGDYAKKLKAPMAFIDKERIDASHVEIRLFVGDVAGKTVLIPDDMCSTGGTLITAAQACVKLGAKKVIAVVGHGLFSGDAVQDIENSPIDLLVTTNSIPHSAEVHASHKIKIVSIASLFAEAVRKD